MDSVNERDEVGARRYSILAYDPIAEIGRAYETMKSAKRNSKKYYFHKSYALFECVVPSGTEETRRKVS